MQLFLIDKKLPGKYRSRMKSFKEIILKFSTDDKRTQKSAFENLSKAFGVSFAAVKAWHTRDLIPSNHWFQLIAVGEKRGVIVTHKKLTALSKKRKSRSNHG